MKTDKKELQNMQPIDKKLYYDPNDSGLGFAVCCIVPQLLAVVILLVFLLHQNTENLSALWSVHFIRPRPLNTQREII